MKIKDVTKILQKLYPENYASDFDIGKIGLTIGNDNIEIKNILLALDLTEEVINEAISEDVNLIITHHPFIFNPITKILFNSKIGRILKLMFDHQISLYTMHTNLDVCNNGVNDTLAKKIGLQNIEGKIEKDSFLRIGNIEEIKLGNLVNCVKATFNLHGVRVVGDLEKKVKKIGIVGGSGSNMVYEAIAAGCDCLITGEVKLHHAQDAFFHKMGVIEVNHGVERYAFETIQTQLKNRLEGKIQVKISKINTDPLINM